MLGESVFFQVEPLVGLTHSSGRSHAQEYMDGKIGLDVFRGKKETSKVGR